MEVWKPVVGFEGVLEVSSEARVRSLDRRCGATHVQMRKGRILKPHLDSVGYLEVNPRVEGKQLKLRVHRLVARAFVPGYFAGAHVNHKDGVKTHNEPSNLDWVTNADNVRHAMATGLNDSRGELSHNSKLKDAQVHEIRALLAAGTPVRDISAAFNIRADMVYGIRTGKIRGWLPVEPLESAQPVL